jgi:hypothetical protein
MGMNCANRTGKRVEDAARSSSRPAFSIKRRSTQNFPQRPAARIGSETGPTTEPSCGFADVQGFFPLSEGHKLIQNFLQSLEPPFLVAGCSCISPVHMPAVRFTNLGYFFPKFLDTL